MNYTNLTLIALGILGIILHNLVELNKLNRTSKDIKLTLKNYFKLEVFSILISLLVVVVAVIVKHEVAQLEQAGKWLGLAFMTIGYMGQSILVFVMGKASKTIDGNDKQS